MARFIPSAATFNGERTPSRLFGHRDLAYVAEAQGSCKEIVWDVGCGL